MFANVEVSSAAPREVLTIPATAVIFAPYGDSVFAIEQQKDKAGKLTSVARQKFVRTGERRGQCKRRDARGAWGEVGHGSEA